MSILRLSTHAGRRVSSVRMLSPIKHLPKLLLCQQNQPTSKLRIDLFPKKDIIAYITKLEMSLNVINKDGKLLTKQQDPDVDALMIRFGRTDFAISFILYDNKSNEVEFPKNEKN
jgi:hypothetical protein